MAGRGYTEASEKSLVQTVIQDSHCDVETYDIAEGERTTTRSISIPASGLCGTGIDTSIRAVRLGSHRLEPVDYNNQLSGLQLRDSPGRARRAIGFGSANTNR